jgi:hypothetical protein
MEIASYPGIVDVMGRSKKVSSLKLLCSFAVGLRF